MNWIPVTFLKIGKGCQTSSAAVAPTRRCAHAEREARLRRACLPHVLALPLPLSPFFFASFPFPSISSKCVSLRRALLPPPSYLFSFPPSFPPSPSLTLPLPPAPSCSLPLILIPHLQGSLHSPTSNIARAALALHTYAPLLSNLSLSTEP